MRYEQKTKGYRICNFSFDCDHPSHEKVVFTIDAKIGNPVIVLPLDNPLYALERLLAPMFVPYLCPLVSIIVEQSRCSTSQLVPLQVKNRLEGCQTVDFWIMGFEILIGLRMEASMTNVVRKLVLLRCKSTQLAVQLHHEGKLYLTCLVVN